MFQHTVTNGRPQQESGYGGPVVVLPLHLLAMIVSYLDDDPVTMARLTLTCRVLHYMTLPQLYQKVHLRSYSGIRMLNGIPEGHGGASPFAMGLNALSTRNQSPFVRSFRLSGKWKEYDVDEHARYGRIPDNSLMLNMVVRLAVDKMDKLESFSWELDTKMLHTVYAGLAQRPSLQSLTISFPALRLPRPTVHIPPMPNLRTLKVMNIDPLCYPDDISLLLFQSKRLRELKLHWSPRMRDQLEPSVYLHGMFSKCLAAKYQIPATSIALQNLYAINHEDIDKIFDPKKLNAFTMINCITGLDTEGVFVDRTWQAPAGLPGLKFMRSDKISKDYFELLARHKGLEKFYIISNRKNPPTPTNNLTPISQSPSSSGFPSASYGGTNQMAGKEYIDILTKNHGKTLKHLLLSNRWSLNPDELSRLIRNCPNLEQLGMSLELETIETVRLVLPFMKKLIAIRILEDPSQPAAVNMLKAYWDDCNFEDPNGDPWADEFQTLKYIGLGDKAFKLGALILQVDDKGNNNWARAVSHLSLEDVKDVEIWKMDSLEMF